MRSPDDLRILGDAVATLGEGMHYDAETDAFVWLDIPASKGWQVTPNGKETPLRLGTEAAFACRMQDGRLLAGGAFGLGIDGRSIHRGTEWLDPNEVLNDGAVHPSGEFLVFGSRDREEEHSTGHMWLLGQHLTSLPWRFTVFNGPAFSPDGTRIFFADSPDRTIFVAPVDADNQSIGDREVFAVVPVELGYPDGMLCDVDGGLWSAHWDGGCVTRYTPQGTVDFRIALPVQRPTSLAFRGNMLAITSAKSDDPADDTCGGHTLTLTVSHKGTPSPRLGTAVLNTLNGEP